MCIFRSTSSMESHLCIPSLTMSDDGSLITCKAVQADSGKFVTTTVRLNMKGDDKTQKTTISLSEK